MKINRNKITKLSRELRAFEQLLAIAKSLHKNDENACNYGSNERREKRTELLEKTADNVAREVFGLYAYHQGDPRGASLYLTIKRKDGEAGNYTNGVCIY